MRLMALSDTHLGMPAWGTFGVDIFTAARQRAEAETFDVVLHNGDIVEPGSGIDLEEGLNLLGKIRARHHLWVAGNNDIEHVAGKTPILEYPWVLQEMAARHGVQLLDCQPTIINGVAFIGNFGFYNLSLWKASDTKVQGFPATYAELAQDADDWHRKNMGITVQELFDFCQKKLQEHLTEMAKLHHKMVVATHTVPTPEMVLYGHSPDFDHKNAWMGWNDTRSKNPIHEIPGVVLQFCGHTHRHKEILREGLPPLINLSGNGQPHIFNF